MSETIIDISDSDPDDDERLFKVNDKINSDCVSSDESESDDDSCQRPKDFWSAVATTNPEANRPGMESDTDLSPASSPACSRKKRSREKNTIPEPTPVYELSIEQLQNERARLRKDNLYNLTHYQRVEEALESKKMVQDKKRKEKDSEATTTDASDSIPPPGPDNVARRQQHYDVDTDDNSISSNRNHNRFGAYDICDDTTTAKSTKTTGLTLSDNVARRQQHYEAENDDNSISSNRKHHRFCANEICDDTTSAKSSKTTGELSSPFQPNQLSSTFDNGSSLTTYDMMLSDLGDYRSNPNFREIVTIQHEQYGPLPLVLYRTDNRTYAQTRRQAVKHYKRFLKWNKIGGKSIPTRSTGIVQDNNSVSRAVTQVKNSNVQENTVGSSEVPQVTTINDTTSVNDHAVLPTGNSNVQENIIVSSEVTQGTTVNDTTSVNDQEIETSSCSGSVTSVATSVSLSTDDSTVSNGSYVSSVISHPPPNIDHVTDPYLRRLANRSPLPVENNTDTPSLSTETLTVTSVATSVPLSTDDSTVSNGSNLSSVISHPPPNIDHVTDPHLRRLANRSPLPVENIADTTSISTDGFNVTNPSNFSSVINHPQSNITNVNDPHSRHLANRLPVLPENNADPPFVELISNSDSQAGLDVTSDTNNITNYLDDNSTVDPSNVEDKNRLLNSNKQDKDYFHRSKHFVSVVCYIHCVKWYCTIHVLDKCLCNSVVDIQSRLDLVGDWKTLPIANHA